MEERKEGRKEGGKEKREKRNTDVREKHQMVGSGMHPDWGWNLQPLVYGMKLQPTEPPGQGSPFLL